MLLKLLKLSHSLDSHSSDISDVLDRLVFSQTNYIDVQISELQKAISLIKQNDGDHAEVRSLLDEILRLRRVGSYIPVR